MIQYNINQDKMKEELNTSILSFILFTIVMFIFRCS